MKLTSKSEVCKWQTDTNLPCQKRCKSSKLNSLSFWTFLNYGCPIQFGSIIAAWFRAPWKKARSEKTEASHAASMSSLGSRYSAAWRWTWVPLGLDLRNRWFSHIPLVHPPFGVIIIIYIYLIYIWYIYIYIYLMYIWYIFDIYIYIWYISDIYFIYFYIFDIYLIYILYIWYIYIYIFDIIYMIFNCLGGRCRLFSVPPWANPRWLRLRIKIKHSPIFCELKLPLDSTGKSQDSLQQTDMTMERPPHESRS